LTSEISSITNEHSASSRQQVLYLQKGSMLKLLTDWQITQKNLHQQKEEETKHKNAIIILSPNKAIKQ